MTARFDREAFGQALDGAIMHLLTIRRILDAVEDEPVGTDPAAPDGPCPDRNGRAHEAVWAPPSLDGSTQGVCAACGAEFSQAAPA